MAVSPWLPLTVCAGTVVPSGKPSASTRDSSPVSTRQQRLRESSLFGVQLAVARAFPPKFSLGVGQTVEGVVVAHASIIV